MNEDSMMRPAFNEMHEIFRLLNLPLNHCYIATLIQKISSLELLKMERNYDDVDEYNNDDNHDQDGGDDVVDDDNYYVD